MGIIDVFSGLLNEILYLYLEMAPYLVFGFFVAGILNILLPRDQVARHLAHNKFSSVLKASLFGVPLPLCSCGVIPVAAHLEKQGANRGPILSFLISTPTTGVDSILATYSLLGPLLAIMRPVAALFNGIFTGVLANTSLPAEHQVACAPGQSVTVGQQGLFAKGKRVFEYAYLELVADVSKWLIIGIVAGGVISYFVPTSLVEAYLGNPWFAYPLMLLIGIPMYVCATGSIPIAASLILKGMSPGAGFIFLFAGPATNTATLSFVGGKIGKKSLVLYLGTILISGILFGALTDYIWTLSGQDMRLVGGHMEMLPQWLKIISAIFLGVFIFRPYILKEDIQMSGKGLLLTVPDMTCGHCKKNIETAVNAIEGVEQVSVDLDAKKVEIVGEAEAESVISAIRNAGYTVETAN